MYRADPHGNQAGLLWGKGFYGEHLRRVLGHLKRALGMEQRLTLQESYDLLLLAEAIMGFGRMVHAYDRLSAPQVIVEVAELEHRFRETKRNMRNALLLLRDMGRAEPARRYGYWKLDLAGFSARKDLPASELVRNSVSRWLGS
jgi:hypothetical protein